MILNGNWACTIQVRKTWGPEKPTSWKTLYHVQREIFFSTLSNPPFKIISYFYSAKRLRKDNPEALNIMRYLFLSLSQNPVTFCWSTRQAVQISILPAQQDSSKCTDQTNCASPNVIVFYKKTFYHRYRWYAALENKILAETLRVIDMSDRNSPITAR